MDEDNTKDKEPQAETIEQVFRERERLDQVIQHKFRKKMAIVFTDVCGYTQFMSTMGDIRGRAWMQKHHDIVLPLIESHDGTVLDIMGDGVMASFPITVDAAKATMAIQKGLHEYNSKPDTIDEIHVTIGINAGEILVDKNHIAGDVVNVASRIESVAEKDQILLSKAVYEDIRDSADILCRYQGTAKVKGKAEPLELYRLVWRYEDVILSAEPRVVPFDQEIRTRGIQPLNVLHIDVARGEANIKISAYEQVAGQESTVRHYEEIPIPMDKINARCLEIVETLNKANRRGLVHRDILMKLKEIGQVFCDDLFSYTVKDLINQTTAEYLNIDLDDQFVQIPWELLHDGRQFLCQRFSMGRLVRTRQNVIGGIRALERPLKMLILADTKGDLKGAYSEGSQILKSVDPQNDFINASFQSENITPDFIREKIRNFDLVHFAGHADYNPNNPGESGWRLMDGIFRAQDIIKMAGTSAMPALVFSNACQSARTEEWDLKEHFQNEIFGLANAFVLAGVKHYIGTFWEILDEPSSHFSLEFYKKLLAGMTIGEAIRQARLSLIKQYGEETIVWGSYLLYGDPAYNYMDQIKMIEAQEEPEPSYATSLEVETRAPEEEEIIDFAEKKVPKKKRAWLWIIAALVILCFGMLFWGYQGYSKSQTEKYMADARQKYDAGNFDAALNTCKTLEDKNSELRLIYLIRGNIYLRRGKLDNAEAAFKKALQAPKGTNSQKAGAFIGLGRIASIRNQPDTALNYYQQATDAAPKSTLGYLSQGLFLENRGDYDKALTLLGKAQKLAPDDQTLAAVTNETRKKVSLSRSQEKQERIDRLVTELLESMKTPPRALASDGWTSPPLTLCIMDFKTVGYSLHEGEERLLVSGITDQMLQHSRVQLVERALLDKLMEELKLGTSKLIDRSTALSLGKILATRLILSGQIVYSGPHTQVSMRLIETETGRITAAVNETFGSATPASVLTDRVSGHLLEKLEKLYPVRGKISGVKDEEIRLNIGQKAGIRAGQRFKVINRGIDLEIISTEQNTSLAKIIKGKGLLEKGLRVEAL